MFINTRGKLFKIRELLYIIELLVYSVVILSVSCNNTVPVYERVDYSRHAVENINMKKNPIFPPQKLKKEKRYLRLI